MSLSTCFEDLETTVEISEEQIQMFRQHGFIKLKNILSPETLKHFEDLISTIVEEKYDRDLAFRQNPELYAKAFQQISNIWEDSEEVRPLVFSKRLAAIATQLLGSRGVRLYHDQALYKEAGGGITPWHCDQVYWPLSTEQTVTVWIPFQETPMEMGPLGFASGSHLKKMGRDLIISQESENIISKAVQKLQVVTTPYDLGEVSFHYGYTMHNAPANLSRSPRKIMTMIYMDSEMTMSEPKTDAQRSDHKNWLKDVEPGQCCNGPLNPVLHEKG